MKVALHGVKSLQLLHEITVLVRKYSLFVFYQERHSNCISSVTGENLGLHARIDFTHEVSLRSEADTDPVLSRPLWYKHQQTTQGYYCLRMKRYVMALMLSATEHTVIKKCKIPVISLQFI